MLQLQPINRDEAHAFIKRHHRHHKAPLGEKFAIAVGNGEAVVGVITVGRPVSREIQAREPYTCEATRCCTDGTKNACSMLYRAAWRAARAMGYRRLITYTNPEEGGASLRAAGFRVVGQTHGGDWNCPSRPRVDLHPNQKKIVWELT